ncbi:MAG TPA: hypothetical protein VFU62_11395 [Hanamia sp.]|nr:hypothetical protein [Hanamia sp.]
MKGKLPETAAATASPLSVSKEPAEGEYLFLLPPGVKFDDIYMDAQVVGTELKICKRIVTNMRKAGKLSYTTLETKGKIFYFRQEIASDLKAHTVIGKKSPLKKLRYNNLITTSFSLLSLFDSFSPVL